MTKIIEQPKAVAYNVGICMASACAPKNLPREEVEDQVNAEHPTGIRSRWTIADEDFQDGTPNGAVCHDDPDRVHWLLSC